MAYTTLNIRPWEFDEYDYDELIFSIRAARKKEVDDEILAWRKFRKLSFYVVAAAVGTKKIKREEELFELPGDKVSKTKAKGKSPKDMTPEELAEWQVAMRKHLENMANPQNN